MPNDLLSSADVADLAGVSVATISREVTRGNLKPHIDKPGYRLFHPRDVRKWLKTRDKAAS
jgi:DNA-binding transcriptional MerR regulator